jgi:hypothetical protein
MSVIFPPAQITACCAPLTSVEMPVTDPLLLMYVAWLNVPSGSVPRSVMV